MRKEKRLAQHGLKSAGNLKVSQGMFVRDVLYMKAISEDVGNPQKLCADFMEIIRAMIVSFF